MEQEVYRHVPYDIECEQAVLGACLINNQSTDIASADLEPEHFYDPLHQRLFEMIVHMQTEGVVTPLVIHAVMKHDAGLQEIGGHAYLAGLMQAAPALPNIKGYARILIDLAARRALIKAGEDLVNAAYESPVESPTADIAEKSTEALGAILAHAGPGRRATFISAADATYDMLRRIEEQAVAEKPLGMRTGIGVIDDVVGGLFPGKLVVVAGRPGMAKSQLATNIGRNVAAWTDENRRAHGIPVDYLSAEMDVDELAARVACEVDYDRCSAERLEPLAYGDFIQMRATQAAVTRLAEANIRISALDYGFFDVSNLTVEWIESTCRRRSQKNPGHRLVIIDHLQLVHLAALRRGANRNEEQTEITGRLKGLAKKLGITVLLISQLSRDVEKRDDKHPQLSDLRESGSIEQDADVVIGILRPLRYAKEKIRNAKNEDQRTTAIKEYDDAKRVLEIGILKNRGGREADYRRAFIEEKSSAIRDREGEQFSDEELRF